MALLIDIGNTRIKWNLRDDLDNREQFAAGYANWMASDVQTELLQSIAAPKQIFIANVGGAAIGRLIASSIQTEWGIAPVFVVASAAAAGVRNAYAVPEKLGVDRWLSIIAAHHMLKMAACVVSVGTATTVDGIDVGGQHLGGIIVPGPELMTASLLKNTSEIAVRAMDGNVQSSLFADNTLGAISQGATHATAAIIERSLGDLKTRTGAEPALILTGGAHPRICDMLRVPYRVVPDLVLRGLAIVSRALDSDSIAKVS